jgi:CBS domain-containing protein
MEARDVMTLGVVTVGPDTPVAQVAKLMLEG